MRFEIRRKTFDFAAAPDLSGREDAAYVPIIASGMMTTDPDHPAVLAEGPRFARAIDAAQEAARMDHEGRHGRRAFVKCAHDGERPAGAMRGLAYVSYRPRGTRP